MNNVYYAIERSPEYLAHYGVKGMRWGVQRALRSGDEKALGKHYAKAQKKYSKLIGKTDITKNANNAYLHRALLRGAGTLTGIQGGLSGALVLHNGKSALPFAGFATAPVATVAGAAGVNYLKNKNRLTSKGHEKAVNKVKKWESEMNKAFKGTKYGNIKQKFDDMYQIDELRYGKNGYYEKTLAKIPGSHLTTDYKGKDKQKFLKIAGSTPSKYPKSYKPGIMSGTKAITSNTKTSYSNKENTDPLSFNYNYHSLTRKRGDKKLPWYMSSSGTYREYHRQK